MVFSEVYNDSGDDFVLVDSTSEFSFWVELPELVEGDDALPEIVDVLGCFCEQTGAQFG